MDRLVGSPRRRAAQRGYDPAGERMVGNIPQAFSHLALIGAAVTLGSWAKSHLLDNLELMPCRDAGAAVHRGQAG